MGPLDTILFWFFSTLAVLGLVLMVISIYRAMKAVGRNDEGLRMFFWAVGALVGLILTSVSLVYILLPLLFFYSKSQ